jgi:uncharacterized protein YbaR (Trm112 family)
MVDPKLLEILCCPETKQDVALAPTDMVERLNRDIAAGTLKAKSGDVVKEKMDAGLLRVDGKVLYPVRDDIPIMLIDESIVL